jgi:hypothetical protein
MDHRKDDGRGDELRWVELGPVEHEQTVEELRGAHARLRDEVIPRVAQVGAALLASPLLIPWHDEIARRLERILNRLAEFDTRLAALLASAALPLRLWRTAKEWTHVRGTASDVAGDLGVTNLEVHVRWQGAAADAYQKIIPAHAAAAARLASVADSTQYALGWGALAAATFFAALLGVVLTSIAGIVTAVAMAATVTGALSGFVLIFAITAVMLGQLAALIVAGTEAFSRLKIFLTDMLSEVRDNSAFPGGAWPLSRDEWYSDASVTDGDADWSVRD